MPGRDTIDLQQSNCDSGQRAEAKLVSGFLFVERGQFEVALNELVDGLQITADVRIKPVFIWAVEESRLTIRA